MTENERIRQSPNFVNGRFRNLSHTPVIAENVSYFKVLLQSLNRPKTVRPSAPLPSQKSDIASSSSKPSVTWFGHSSYLIRINDFTILVDPVLSGHASPFSWMIKAFAGTDIYTTDDFPNIDALIITHNHFDHLDTSAIARLKPKIRSVYTTLGTAKDIHHIDPSIITELDWYQWADVRQQIRLTALPARHFSGRGIQRNRSLWASFALKIFDFNIYIGGDSGYDTVFSEIGQRYGPFDIAVLECGQYNNYWPYIHMMPEQTAQAAVDLQAKTLLPVHWGKFTLANHPWDEPIRRVTKKAQELGLQVTTPVIGEQVILGERYPNSEWWQLNKQIPLV